MSSSEISLVGEISVIVYNDMLYTSSYHPLGSLIE